jgi:hypothetical protein
LYLTKYRVAKAYSSALDRGELSSLDSGHFNSGERTPVFVGGGGSGGPSDDLNTLKREKVSCFCQESNPESSFLQLESCNNVVVSKLASDVSEGKVTGIFNAEIYFGYFTDLLSAALRSAVSIMKHADGRTDGQTRFFHYDSMFMLFCAKNVEYKT